MNFVGAKHWQRFKSFNETGMPMSMNSTSGLAYRRDESSLISRPDEFLLLREFNHRLANTLAVLASGLRRELMRFPPSEVRSSFERYEARIVAFGTLHRSLIVGGSEKLISASCHLEKVCGALAEALLQPLGVACEMVCEIGELPQNICERLGLLIAELVTNSAKHAYHGRTRGLVRVAVARRRESLICLVSDDGSSSRDWSAGTGSTIINELVFALRGEIVVQTGANGTSVVVTCDLESPRPLEDFEVDLPRARPHA